MAGLSDLVRRLVAQPPVPPTPTDQLRRRWRRRRFRQASTVIAALVMAGAGIAADVTATGPGESKVRIVAPTPTMIPPTKPTGLPANASVVDLSWTNVEGRARST